MRALGRGENGWEKWPHLRFPWSLTLELVKWLHARVRNIQDSTWTRESSMGELAHYGKSCSWPQKCPDPKWSVSRALARLHSHSGFLGHQDTTNILLRIAQLIHLRDATSLPLTLIKNLPWKLLIGPETQAAMTDSPHKCGSRTGSLSPKRKECRTKSDLCSSSHTLFHLNLTTTQWDGQTESPLWQMVKLKLEKLKQLSQGHMAGQWQVSLYPRSMVSAALWGMACSVCEWEVQAPHTVCPGAPKKDGRHWGHSCTGNWTGELEPYTRQIQMLDQNSHSCLEYNGKPMKISEQCCNSGFLVLTETSQKR